MRSKIYSVKEIYLTVQGEGAHSGRAAVFLRFAGCNLWSGRARDRSKAVCKFCDTDFVGMDGPGGGQFPRAEDLASAVSARWPTGQDGQASNEPWVVCTGGEPLLQLDSPLIEALHNKGFKVAVETNGTIKAPLGIDWLCVSPKADAPLVQTSGDELKLVFPQRENRPEDFEHLDFKRFSLQPLDEVAGAKSFGKVQGANIAHTQAAFEYCMAYPKWALSLQTHKLIGVP